MHSGLSSYMRFLILSLNITLLTKGYNFLTMISHDQLSCMPGLLLTGLTACESLLVENALSVYVLTNHPYIGDSVSSGIDMTTLKYFSAEYRIFELIYSSYDTISNTGIL